jgi:hypothetical protein
MVYSPPARWIQPNIDRAEMHAERFHSRTDCPRIRNADQPRGVDRPYSAKRCPGCADEHGNKPDFPTRRL